MSVERLLEALQQHGPMKAAELCGLIGASQPTLSRLLRTLTGQVLVCGKARATFYAARRPIEGVPERVPIYEVRPVGEPPRLSGWVVPVYPQGYALQQADGAHAGFTRDLPWHLQDLRPSGFLGRLQAARQRPPGLPQDIGLWSADQVLSFLCHTGFDLPGAFVVGEQAYQGFLLQAVSPGKEVAAQQRLTRYPQIALEVASFGNPGCSAGGEQPKFLATVVQEAQSVPVLVKYSPVVDNPLAQRISDLLVAEHLALSCLARAGAHAVESDLLMAQGRTFLEVRRFDRQGTTHRIGQVTLASLDAEFVGSDLTSWLDSASRLVALGILPESVLLPVGFLQLFGSLIGNSDMHFGNLAFFLDGLRVTSLAPAYDMLPMHYFPARHELNDRPFPLPSLSPAHAPYALAAIDAAATFWAQVASDPRISPAFQTLALAHTERVAGLRAVAALLPE